MDLSLGFGLDKMHKEFFHWAFYFAIEENKCEEIEKLQMFSSISFFDLMINEAICEFLIKNDQHKMIVILLKSNT